MDSIRSAVRKCGGGHVTLLYRRDRSDMPADPEEEYGAVEVEIHLVFQKIPVRILGTDHVEGIVVQSTDLGPPDAGGRRTPVPVPGSEATIPCDTVIVAVGQHADLLGFGPELDLRITSQGWPEGKGPGFQTAIPGVFAAGGRSVVYAQGAAIKAAEAIDAYLCEKRGEKPVARPDPFGGAEPYALPPGYTQAIRS